MRKSIKISVGAAAILAAGGVGILVDSGFRAALDQAVSRAIQVRALQQQTPPQDKLYNARFGGGGDIRYGGGGDMRFGGGGDMRFGGGGDVKE